MVMQLITYIFIVTYINTDIKLKLHETDRTYAFKDECATRDTNWKVCATKKRTI